MALRMYPEHRRTLPPPQQKEMRHPEESQEGGEVRGTGGTEPRPFPPHHHEPEPRPQPRTLYRRGGACCICTLDCPAGHGHDNEASHLVSCTFNFCPVFLVMQPESGESRAARAEGPQESGFPKLEPASELPGALIKPYIVQSHFQRF